MQLFKKGEYKNARNQEIKKEIRIPFLALAAEVQEMGLQNTLGGEMMSSAMSIRWHEECLENKKQSLKWDEEGLLNLQKRVERERQECIFYEIQIIEAEKEHKDKFDRNRYLVKKVKK